MSGEPLIPPSPLLHHNRNRALVALAHLEELESTVVAVLHREEAARVLDALLGAKQLAFFCAASAAPVSQGRVTVTRTNCNGAWKTTLL